MKLFKKKGSWFLVVAVAVAASLSYLSGRSCLQGLDYLSSQIAWQKETDGSTNPTTTTAHIVHDSTITKDWWEPYVDAISQPFHPWNGTKWCDDKKPKGKQQAKSHGLMLSKVHKAASSTAAGVTLRISHRVATRRGHANAPCLSYYDHEFSLRNDHSSRDPSTSFLWATVREPYLRARSAFFFFQTEKNISQLDFLKQTVGNQLRQVRKRETSTANKLRSWGGSFKGRSAGLKNSMVSNDPHKLGFEYIKEHVLQWYDFIAVTERWEESMVVMKLLLNEDLEYADFVVLKSKASGSFAGKTCHYVPIATTPPEVAEYLQTTYRKNNPDYLLYAAVNRSLDLTIDLLGRGRVEKGVRQLQNMQALAQEECLSKAIFPCSANGTRQPGYEKDCYEKDFGCGYRCVDAVLDEYTGQES
jgi:hypothetical protein